MMALFKIALLGLIIFAFGCASSVKKNGKPALAEEFTQDFEESTMEALKFKADKCESKLSLEWKVLVSLANRCVADKNWKVLNDVGQKLATDYSQAPWGSYFLSLAAEGENNLKKSLWMAELSLKKSPGLKILKYQKARVLFKLGDHATAEKEFAQLRDAAKLEIINTPGSDTVASIEGGAE